MNTSRWFGIFAFVLAAFQLFAVESSIDADCLLDYKSSDSPKKIFALNGKLMQIKLSGRSLQAAWVGYNLSPSENAITFTARSLNGKNVAFSASVDMKVYHADAAEKCNGRSKPKRFIFGNYAQAANRQYHMPLVINAADLQCTQCGRPVKIGRFIFYFETKDPGGIEFSPFTLQSVFPVRIQAKKDAQSSYLSNILAENYKPYEKKLPQVSRLSQDVLHLSQRMNMIRSQYRDFRLVLELLQKKDYKNAVLQAEQIGKENLFCSMMLYLVYSRGYYDVPKDYQRSAEYFNTLIGSYIHREPAFMFWQYEYKNVWAKYRLVPNYPDEKVTIKAWSASGFCMDEIVPLRGKYPLENCYEERMQNIGGVGARVLYLAAREQSTLQNILEESRKLGNAEAWAGDVAHFIQRSLDPESRAVVSKPDGETFKNLTRAAELGYIPAKLHLAELFITKNYTPEGLDPAAARTLLRDSIGECEKYAAAGCKHADADLRYARKLLSFIPDENSSTADLLKLYEQLQKTLDNNQYDFKQFRLNIVAEMIKQRNDDTPDALFVKAINLPDSQGKEKREMLRKAAERGSHKAIIVCLNSISRNDNDYMHFLILAGKNKLPYNGNAGSFFNEAYRMLEEKRFQLPPPEYLKELGKIAPYHERARKEYQLLTRDLALDIAVSDPATISAVKINDGGRHSVKIVAQASDQKRYITVKTKSAEKIRGNIQFFSPSPKCSNYDVYGEFTDGNNRVQKIYSGSFVPMQYIPSELKIFIAPRDVLLDLRIIFMLL